MYRVHTTLVIVVADVGGAVESIEVAACAGIALLVTLSRPSDDVVLGSKSAHSFPEKPCGQIQASSLVVASR